PSTVRHSAGAVGERPNRHWTPKCRAVHLVQLLNSSSRKPAPALGFQNAPFDPLAQIPAANALAPFPGEPQPNAARTFSLGSCAEPPRIAPLLSKPFRPGTEAPRCRPASELVPVPIH